MMTPIVEEGKELEAPKSVIIGQFHPRVFEKWFSIHKSSSPDHRNTEPIHKAFKELSKKVNNRSNALSYDFLISEKEYLESKFGTWENLKRILNQNYKGCMIGNKAFQKIVMNSGYMRK